ncbi:MAG: hypothetical protein M1404_05300 [Acidobacteria bacterium]|nr:hypothetical protein [Acidobacteriota bacterium]
MDAFDPTTPENMRLWTLGGVDYCQHNLKTSGSFDQRFFYVGSTVEEFKLSPRGCASSLSRIFEEAHKTTVRAHADLLCLVLRRPMGLLNDQCTLELWESIFVVTQTTKRTTIAMLPFRKTASGLEFAERRKGECETDAFASPEQFLPKVGYEAVPNALDGFRQGRCPGNMSN